jgi:hypothetical protein
LMNAQINRLKTTSELLARPIGSRRRFLASLSFPQKRYMDSHNRIVKHLS